VDRPGERAQIARKTLPLTHLAPIATNASFLIPDALARGGDDPIFALNAEAQRRANAGESIVNATLGTLIGDDGRLAVLPSVFEAFARVDPARAAAYAPIAGEPQFLAAVLRDLFKNSPLVSQAVAVATPGGTGALHHAIVNFLEPGQALLAPELFWGPYQTLAEHTRRRVETFAMFDAARRFDTKALERALERQVAAQQRALLLLNTPCNNPTGYSLDDAEWREVVRIVRQCSKRAPITLVVDLAYAKFAGERAEHWVSHAEKLAGDALVLVAWTASKSFAQYGARIGALVAVHPDEGERKRIAAALAFSCRGTWSNCNHLGMLAITSLLTDPELAARSNDEREKLRALLDERVAAFNRCAHAAGLDFPRYEGGFFVSVFTREPERAAARMRELGVFVVPIHGAVRIALCSTPARDVPRLVDALVQGLRAAQSAQP
jgi:aromatic-amino-acid transaminase